MRSCQLLAIWLLWVLAAVQTGAAVKFQKGHQKRQQQPPEQQQPFQAFLGLLTASSAPSISTFQSLQQYNSSLPLPLVKNGLVYKGSNARLRRVVNKLLHHEPLNIGVVGSSITYGRGVERGTSDWFTHFSSWLQTAFPASKVAARNGAVPLARSEYIGACLEQHVDPHVDLVFIEVTAADGYLDTSINNELVHAFERLVRKLLKLPNKPAVVLLNTLHPSQSHGPNQQQQQPQPAQEKQKAPASLGAHSQQQQQQQPPLRQNQPQPQPQPQPQQLKVVQGKQLREAPFYHTIEDHYGVVAQYYELPWLSLRNAVWQGLVAGLEGFKPQDLFTEAKLHSSSRTKQQQETGNSKQLQQHASYYLPNGLCHKYMADLAVGLLQQTFVQEMLRPLPPSDAAAADKLPVPMFPGNWEGHGSGCAAGVDFRAAVRDAHKDWYFVNEGTPAHPRWGFVSHVPNATLVLQLDTRSKGATSAVPRLTTEQKVQLLQRHGLFAAAADLLTAQGAAAMPPISVPAAAAEAAASAQIWQGNGVEAAMAEAERQAATAAVQLRLGQVKPYVNSERIVGVNPYSTLKLPQEARLEVGATKTATGVEVIMPGGRRLTETPRQQGAESAPASAAAAAAAAAAEAEEHHHSSSSRAVRNTGNPQVIPPPYDAIYLKPKADGASSSSSSTAPVNTSSNSSSSSSGAAPGTVGASIFSEYSFLPHPNMMVLVGYTKSHHLMGRARIFCMSGCSCKDVVVDGWHPQHHNRLAAAKLRVTQSPECLIGVQVLPETSTGHHKFKVTSVMVSQSVHYRTAESEWSHQYFLHPELIGE